MAGLDEELRVTSRCTHTEAPGIDTARDEKVTREHYERSFKAQGPRNAQEKRGHSSAACSEAEECYRPKGARSKSKQQRAQTIDSFLER